MAENEAIKVIKRLVGISPSERIVRAVNVTVSALEEIQQYREIGTVEECREAKERQTAKKCKEFHPCESVTYCQCPCCDGLLHINENFCGECGQAISWEDEEWPI